MIKYLFTITLMLIVSACASPEANKPNITDTTTVIEETATLVVKEPEPEKELIEEEPEPEGDDLSNTIGLNNAQRKKLLELKGGNSKYKSLYDYNMMKKCFDALRRKLQSARLRQSNDRRV